MTSLSSGNTTRQRLLHRFLPLLAIGIGLVALIHYFSLRSSLWEDELIALTHTFQPLPSFFMEVLRNDIHPFVYFLVLKGWMLFSPESGTWALASSLALTLVSALVLYLVARSTSGATAALWATAIFLLLPTTAWGAGNLRMYGLVPALIVGVWYVNVRFIQRPSRWCAVALVLLEACAAYVHAIEFIFVAFVVLAIAIEHFKTTTAKVVKHWVILQCIAGVAMLPLPLSALMRGTEPLPPSSWDSFIMIFGQTVAGAGGDYLEMLTWAGVLVFGTLVFLGMQSKRWRITVLVVPVGVLLAVYIIGFLGKPIFKPPVFSANLMPFLALGAGAGIAHVLQQRRRLATALTVVFTAALACVTMPWAGNFIPQESYQAAAAYVKQRALPGDMVIAPHLSVYWGVMFYAEGADWGFPLAIRPPDNPQWRNLTAKLGAERSQALSLIPEKAFVDAGGIRYCVGSDVAACASGVRRAWVIDRRSYNNGVEFSQSMAVTASTMITSELAVSQLDAGAEGQTRFENPFLRDSFGKPNVTPD
ncbi:hypothetical protein AB2N08_12910 [Massilia aurea]|uniref:hypothetical protein n=1 Tax=Massilia aurea TaxID=373040 RepID=UPI0034626516